jgi:SAM-dependent methyltransferase
MGAWTHDTSSAEELKQQARDRLYPKLHDPNYLILDRRRRIFQKWLADVPGQLRVLDVGGRLQPYRPLLEERLAAYAALDIRSSALVSVVAKGEQIPLASGVFDLVICTQVLEYVFDPSVVVKEIHRVLKPGGVLLLSVPAIFPRDADEECWRFEPAALRTLLAGFSKFEIQPEGSSIRGFLRTVNVFLVYCAKSMVLKTALSYLVAAPLNLLAEALESLVRTENTVFTANYSAFARK